MEEIVEETKSTVSSIAALTVLFGGCGEMAEAG
jgi:hypothetical protein